jgi:hypothetical protein
MGQTPKVNQENFNELDYLPRRPGGRCHGRSFVCRFALTAQNMNFKFSLNGGPGL